MDKLTFKAHHYRHITDATIVGGLVRNLSEMMM